MPVLSSHLFSAMFEAMLHELGPSHWWPAQSPFEVAVGAILTQNASWTNVEKAISNLRVHGLLDPVHMHQASVAQLEECIRPSGFFRQKTKKLLAFLAFLEQECALDFAALGNWETSVLRARLLAVKGIGLETADSILLYALHRPVFVVDAYTARIYNRHGVVPEEISYEELQDIFMRHIRHDAALFNEYHALLVRVGKDWCRKNRPRCPSCPLRSFLP
jgi:endonuclease III related protein